MSRDLRDVLTPKEVAERSGFSYHSILRAIRRGDLEAFEPIMGQYRIDLSEYERWLRRPAKRVQQPSDPGTRVGRSRANSGPPARGSFASLQAIEGN